MDRVLPNREPYRFKWGNRVLLNVGRPVDLAKVRPPIRRPLIGSRGTAPANQFLCLGLCVCFFFLYRPQLMSQPAYLRADDRGRRQLITDRIQHELMALKEQTERLYADLCSDA